MKWWRGWTDLRKTPTGLTPLECSESYYHCKSSQALSSDQQQGGKVVLADWPRSCSSSPLRLAPHPAVHPAVPFLTIYTSCSEMQIFTMILKAVETAQVWEKATLHRKESRERETRNKRQKQTGQTRNRVPTGYLRRGSILHLTAIRRTPHYTTWLWSRGSVPCLEAHPLRGMLPPHCKPRQTLPGKQTLLNGWSQVQTAFSGSSHLPDIFLTSTVPKRKVSVQDDQVPFPFWASVSASAKWREGGTRAT